MGRGLLTTGLVVAAASPLITVFGLAAHQLMGCTGGGSSGPVSGCHLLGFEFNFFAALATPAFAASFFTVPIGIVLCVFGLISSAASFVTQKRGPHGNFGASGQLLGLAEATSVISKFERSECNALLQSFGAPLSPPTEPLQEARARCVNVLMSANAYAA